MSCIAMQCSLLMHMYMIVCMQRLRGHGQEVCSRFRLGCFIRPVPAPNSYTGASGRAPSPLPSQAAAPAPMQDHYHPQQQQQQPHQQRQPRPQQPQVMLTYTSVERAAQGVMAGEGVMPHLQYLRHEWNQAPVVALQAPEAHLPPAQAPRQDPHAYPAHLAQHPAATPVAQQQPQQQQQRVPPPAQPGTYYQSNNHAGQ